MKLSGTEWSSRRDLFPYFGYLLGYFHVDASGTTILLSNILV
jgi:hypothetical protein